MLRATAVRKTATTKKKKTEARDGKGRKHVVDVGDGDDVWRPLGAGVTGGNHRDGEGGQGEGEGEDGMGLLQPPRMSEEVQPVNLQGLFEGEEVNEFSKVAVFVRIRPDGGRGREEPGALGSVGSLGHNHYPHQRACLYAESGSRLGVSAPLGSLAYENGECQVGQLMAFNRVFGPETSQTEYYVQTSKALVEQLVQRERYEGVFLSYGITASGKTYTIQGTKESPGIIPLALWTLFGKLTAKGEGAKGGGTGAGTTKVEISYCEIYNEAIYDLLTDSPGSHAHVHGKRPALKLMEAKDGSMMVDKLSWVTVGHAQEAWNVLRGGMKQRKRAASKLNYSSSRSHSVCSIRLTDMVSGNMSSRKLSFVDLAGSERAHRTGTAGAGAGSSSHGALGSLGAHGGMAARMKEAVSINGSLMTLGRCLEALRLNQKNKTTTQVIPYRESKVTHMFRDALHGYGNVVLSVNVSPAPVDFDETLRVLKYAATASQIATTAAKPVKPSQMTMGETGAVHLQQMDARLLPRPAMNTMTTTAMTTTTTSPTKQGRIRKETPLGLRRHRQLMEMGRRDERVAADVSVSIDSRIQGASPSPLIPQLLCEEEIDNKGGALAVDEGAMEMIREEESSSSGGSSDEEDQEEDEGDGGVTMRGGKPARGFAAHEDEGVDEADDADIAEGDAVKHHEDHKDAVIARLRHDLRVAEQKLQEVEAEVRDEVATEMTQIIDTVEEKYKQQIEDDAKAAEARVRKLEAKHEGELASMEATIESQQRGLDELRAAVGDLERRASKRRKKAAAAEEDAQRYKNALNDALAEIEKLHGIIEQEEEANAKLAASLSDILREQSLPDSPNSPNSPGRDVREAAKIKRIKREVKREVTQLEANNAMEQDMSEQMIDRLKKDNEVLRSKLVAMTHAIESCCTPSRNAVFQNLVTACPAGHGRGAGGTPHDVALARARRLLDNGSPAADESPKDSITKSRFAKEAQGGSESPKAIGNGTSADIGGLLAVGGGEEVQPLETIKTQGTPSTLNSKEERTTKEAKEATPPRRSPRKHLSSSAGDDANEDEGRTEMEAEAEAVAEKEEAVEPELPKTATRVTRRNRNAKKKASKNDVDIDATPVAAKPTVPKSRKLLSTASKQTPMRMLGISNTSAAKRSRRLGALPTAEELGFKT